jgi:hypothetical protein
MEVTDILITRDKRKQFRYEAKAANGAVVDRAEESFKRRDYVISRCHSRYPFATIRVKYESHLERKNPVQQDYVVKFDD